MYFGASIQTSWCYLGYINRLKRMQEGCQTRDDAELHLEQCNINSHIVLGDIFVSQMNIVPVRKGSGTAAS